MKILRIALLTLPFLLFLGCDKSKFGFSSSNCGEVYTNCLTKCTQSGKTRAECLNGCERSKGMCQAVKIKGCMQDCNTNYGKNSPSAEACKRSCAENRAD